MASAIQRARGSTKQDAPKLPQLPDFEKRKGEKVEVCEDEEQEKKFLEIVDFLLAAGYFRARIKGLSPFDKVVGGMAWCIETCSVDIDVDLLFQENLTIGQKIALTEKIVAVLPKMKCPHSLEPHQIQGLDFIHIFPVIQWLVKRAIETREETGDYIRAFSISQFQKQYVLPNEESSRILEQMKIPYRDCKYSYRPQRMYKHHAPHKIKQEQMRVQTTLLEYGKKFGFTDSFPSEKCQDHKENGDGSLDSNREQTVAENEKRIQTLMNSMLLMDDHESKLSASSVGSIVGLQSGEIQQIVSEFAKKRAELANESLSERGVGGAEYYKRAVSSLSHELSEKKRAHKECEAKHNDLKTIYEEYFKKLKELQEMYDKMVKEMQMLEEAETTDEKSILQKLKSLVAMNENLKKQEQEFRVHCKEEMARLKSTIEELNVSPDEGGISEGDERRQLIEKQYVVAKEKLQKIRVLLARKNREIATLQRKIDEVPSRAELSQYQKRFIELYNQVATKHKETKQFYTLYNTLEDTRMYLLKEVDLLNSIQDNFTEAMSSAGTKEQFLVQLEQIVEKLQLNKQKLEKRKLEEKSHRDRVNDQLLDLIEKQRLYFKTVKEFKEECRKNEILVAKLKEKVK